MKHTMKPLINLARISCLAGLFSICSIAPSSGVPSSEGSGEIAIYSETTGADVITTADFTHDFDTDDSVDPGSFSRSGSDITLLRDGHYLAIYNARFNGAPQAGSEERVEVQSCLNLAGTKLPVGWSQGFIRRQQNHLDAITTGMAVIEASADDVLQLQSFRTDTTTIGSVTRFAGETAIQLVKLDDINMSYARLSLATNQTGPATDGQSVKVAYDTEDEIGAGFTHSGGDLTIADAGKYLVTANTYIIGYNNRHGLIQELRLDGSPISGTRTNIYLRGNQSTVEGAASVGTIIETTAANQVLSVHGELDGGSGVTNFIAAKCGLTVVKLPSAAGGTSVNDPDFIRLSHAANQNINTSADIVFDTQTEVDLEYVHSPGTAPITVATGGDYLFLGAYYGANDGAARGLSNPGWAINGTRLGRGQSGRYTRNLGPPEFGNTLGLIAPDLAANDEVKMVTRALAGAGTNNANPIALQGVRLASLFTAPATFEVVVTPLVVDVEEGGATAAYEISLGLDPGAGAVEVTVTADADTEVSLDGVTFTPSVSPSFTSGGVPQTITVRAADDSDIESDHVASLTHAITATDDPGNYPTTMEITGVVANVTDNDVVAVTAVDDASTSNLSEDLVGDEALTGNLLANDNDGFQNAVIASDSRSVLGAVVSVNSDGTFTYDPTRAASLQQLQGGESAVDTFAYTVEDAEGNTSSATVSITVDGANDGILAADDVLSDGPLEDSVFVNTESLTINDGIVGGREVVTFPPGSDLRLLPGLVVSQSPSVGAPPGGGVPERALDGNVGTFTHTDSNDNTVDHTWQVDFGQDVSLENVTLFNRTDCCGVRLRDITVTVLDGAGGTVFTSPLLNPTSDPQTIVPSLFVDFAGPITGRTLVVTRTPDLGDVVSDGSILSLGEVTVIGSAPGNYFFTGNQALLNYDAGSLVDNGLWQNEGTRGGTGMDWVLTGVTLDASPVTSRTGIKGSFEWDALTDDATLAGGLSASIHDNLPGADTADATWEFWVKPANTTDVMTLFETGGGTGFGLIIDKGVLEAATELDGFTKDGSYVSYDLLADPKGLVGGDPTTDFNQYAVTITVGGGLQLYVNGVLVDETTSGTSGDWDGGDGAGLGGFGETNHGGFISGAANNPTSDPGYYDATFLGQMAIVRLYSGVLSGAEVMGNYRAVDAGMDIDGDTIVAEGVIDGTGTFVANNTQAALSSGALVTITDATGGFEYDPNGAFSLLSGETTTDSFTYQVSDGNGGISQAQVMLTITGVADITDDNLLAKEGQIVTYTPNEFLKNDEIEATPGAYVDLSPPRISGGLWINQGSAGAARNATLTGPVLASPSLTSGFQTIGCAPSAAALANLDAISTGDASFELWFKPDAGQTGKLTVFETGGNGNGFSIVFDADTNEVIATVDGGDDTNNNIVAIAGGISTSEFNQVIVVIEPNGGAETAPASGVFVDLLTVYVNNDPTQPFDPAVDASAENAAGTANDWCGTDGGGLNAISGTTARNENFPAATGAIAILRVYPSVLTLAEMETNYDFASQSITAVSSPTTSEGASVTLNGDGTVSVDYSAISLATGAFLNDSFTYTTSSGTATVNVTIEGNTIQEDWRLTYYGSIENSGPGADDAIAANGQSNLINFAADLDPTAPAGTLETSGGAITSLGPPQVWTDPADGKLYFRYTRRADFAAIPLTLTEQFSPDVASYEDNALAPIVVATGTGDSGAAIEAVVVEFPLVLPGSGRKARFARLQVTTP